MDINTKDNNIENHIDSTGDKPEETKINGTDNKIRRGSNISDESTRDDANENSNDNYSSENGSSFTDKPRRRPSILSRTGRRRGVQKSVSFCSMPEDRRVSNGKHYY